MPRFLVVIDFLVIDVLGVAVDVDVNIQIVVNVVVVARVIGMPSWQFRVCLFGLREIF